MLLKASRNPCEFRPPRLALRQIRPPAAHWQTPRSAAGQGGLHLLAHGPVGLQKLEELLIRLVGVLGPAQLTGVVGE